MNHSRYRKSWNAEARQLVCRTGDWLLKAIGWGEDDFTFTGPSLPLWVLKSTRHRARQFAVRRSRLELSAPQKQPTPE